MDKLKNTIEAIIMYIAICVMFTIPMWYVAALCTISEYNDPTISTDHTEGFISLCRAYVGVCTFAFALWAYRTIKTED
jgi:hypothetical protein